MRKVELTLENDVNPKIQLLVEDVLPAAKKFEKAAGQLETPQSDMESRLKRQPAESFFGRLSFLSPKGRVKVSLTI